MNLVARVKGILTNPKNEWASIDAEPLNLGAVLTGYVLPLAAIGPIAMMIGWSAFGYGIFRLSMGWIISHALLSYILTIVGVFVLAWIINMLAPTFGATQNMSQAIKVAVYSSTASWVAGIFNIMPALAVLAIIGGIYSLYLFWLGLPVLMKPPADKASTYAIVTIIACIVVFFVIGAITSRSMF
ncbi:MAG TPA: Yip1 family protein [Tepidisphaeraceae bacterium]|nr:Yip1 family protein [Tepidisphaeraceae bacterium]